MNRGEILRMAQYGRCYESVTRKGELQPCDEEAVAIRRDPEDRSPYPVCAYHARAEMVSLKRLVEMLS